MSIVTSQQLARYFEQYRATEVTFNKEVIDATGLLTRNVYLKVADQQWPCIIYACSLTGAKVIASVKNAFFNSLRQSNSHVSLRCCFRLPDKTDPISFFVPSHAAGFTPYNQQNPDVQIIGLEFAQRPPDDLILILGTLLEANATAKRRKEERIILTTESLKKLGLESRESLVTVDGVPRRCLLRDLSFSGAKVLVAGGARDLDQKNATLRILKGEQGDEISLAGAVKRIEEVEGRSDILALGIQFSAEPPMSYKIMISGYLSAARKTPAGPAAPAPRGGSATGG
ncbi:MAG: PilZ domain-containing protein [Spirochaetes bacterium]|nr:PilZ domain-containing protein [Spirochaetota bacterium]